MQTETIKCSNIKEKDGQYGPSLQISYKQGEEWRNFFVNDASLFGYFERGKSVTIEYEKKGNWNIIKGVSAAAQGSNGNGPNGNGGEDTGRQRSIEMQAVIKACATLLAGKDMTAAEFAAFAKRVHSDTLADPIDTLKKQATESLGATPVEDDEDIPF
jgi:hypothetical protein